MQINELREPVSVERTKLVLTELLNALYRCE